MKKPGFMLPAGILAIDAYLSAFFYNYNLPLLYRFSVKTGIVPENCID